MIPNFTSPMNILTIALVALGSFQAVSAAVPWSGTKKIHEVTEEQMKLLAPGTAKGCDGKQFKDECTIPSLSAKLFNKAMLKWNVNEFGLVAAALSNMAFESGDFSYNTNHWGPNNQPRPGQGTKAMLTFPFIFKYVIACRLQEQMVPYLDGKKPKDLDDAAIAAVSGPNMNLIRKLVEGNDYTFGSGLWHLKSCPAAISDGLRTDGYIGFKNYIENCIQTGEIITPAHKRVEKWCLTIRSLGMTTPKECPPPKA